MTYGMSKVRCWFIVVVESSRDLHSARCKVCQRRLAGLSRTVVSQVAGRKLQVASTQAQLAGANTMVGRGAERKKLPVNI